MRYLSIFAFFYFVSSLAMSAPLKGSVYSPRPGIVCDKKARFCVDEQGISLGHTRAYFGQQAEGAIMARINDAGGPSGYDLTWFAFSNGVDCKTKVRLCHVAKHSDKVDAAHTKALFGP